ncbi:MAG TPA: COX15/CtaA family protein [Flavitalea sp.]|nr:COX15/CtaA family protein [Flavitalea sp.]
MISNHELERAKRWVSAWIITGVVMLLIQVVLGGITRLTGSGLSITEWNVVTGAFPPLNEQDWLAEFQKYQQTPQYRLLNTDFTLADFKFIFFWEWFHRFWARLIGVVFLVGFVYLVARRYLKKEMHNPLLILFLLGAFQGAIGWIMVASGLTGDAVYVKPTKLALHFIFALGLISYAWWFALDLRISRRDRIYSSPLRNYTWVVLIILLIQLIFGALMAGHKAATAAPTWPSINGSMWPETAFRGPGILKDLVENKISIHLVHRSLAYALFVLIIFYVWKCRQVVKTGLFARFSSYPMILVVLQVLLGIASVLLSPRIVPNHWGPFEWMAQLHQVTGMLLLLSIVNMLYVIRPGKKIG